MSSPQPRGPVWPWPLLLIGGVIYRELNWQHLRKAIIEGGISTAVVMLLVASSALVGNYLTELQVPQQLALAITRLTENRYMVLALLNVFFFVVGLFLHSAAAIILVVPIVMPLVNTIGIDPVHFGIIVTLNLGIGQQTPPVASVRPYRHRRWCASRQRSKSCRPRPRRRVR